MSCTRLPKAMKPAWAEQLTQLPCLVVYVKFHFLRIGNQGWTKAAEGKVLLTPYFRGPSLEMVNCPHPFSEKA